MSINAAHDEEFLAPLARSGCQGVLIGFESLDDAVLKNMNKNFNTMRGGFEVALANLRRHHIRVYGTFVFGYDGDTPGAAEQAAEFSTTTASTSRRSTISRPFPGTPLYTRLEKEKPAAVRPLVARRSLPLQRPALPPHEHGAR